MLARIDLNVAQIEEADIDGSGEISWWEFCQMMQKMMDDDSRDIEAKRQAMIAETEAGTERGPSVSSLVAAHAGSVTREVIGKKIVDGQAWATLDEDNAQDEDQDQYHDLAAEALERMQIMNGSHSSDVLTQTGGRRMSLAVDLDEIQYASHDSIVTGIR